MRVIFLILNWYMLLFSQWMLKNLKVIGRNRNRQRDMFNLKQRNLQEDCTWRKTEKLPLLFNCIFR